MQLLAISLGPGESIGVPVEEARLRAILRLPSRASALPPEYTVEKAELVRTCC